MSDGPVSYKHSDRVAVEGTAFKMSTKQHEWLSENSNNKINSYQLRPLVTGQVPQRMRQSSFRDTLASECRRSYDVTVT